MSVIKASPLGLILGDATADELAAATPFFTQEGLACYDLPPRENGEAPRKVLLVARRARVPRRRWFGFEA